MQSPCNWAVEYPSGTDSALARLSDTERVRVESMSTEFLWHWTGQRFGECPATIRPCRRPLYVPSIGDRFSEGVVQPRDTAGWWPVMLGGQWYNVRCGLHGDNCGCENIASIQLPREVTEVTAVTYGGQIVPDTSYVLDDHLLVRTDGAGWPVVLSTHGPEESAFELNVTYGHPVPQGGRVAAGVLAAELAKALRGDNGCQLPRRLQTITREGMTVGLMDTFDDIGDGHTGIWLVDSWVSSIVNPIRASQVYSPDVPRRRYRRVH